LPPLRADRPPPALYSRQSSRLVSLHCMVQPRRLSLSFFSCPVRRRSGQWTWSDTALCFARARPLSPDYLSSSSSPYPPHQAPAILAPSLLGSIQSTAVGGIPSGAPKTPAPPSLSLCLVLLLYGLQVLTSPVFPAACAHRACPCRVRRLR
jgi:hypothetical protein